MSSCHSLHTSSCSSQQPKCFLHSSLNFVTIRHHTFPTKLHTTPFTVLHCIFLLRYSQASTHASNSSAHGASQLSTAFSQPSFTWLLHFPKTFPVFLCPPHNSSHSPVHSLASLTQYSQCYTHTHTRPSQFPVWLLRFSQLPTRFLTDPSQFPHSPQHYTFLTFSS